eukprot:14478995-Alexandrium_andersonii.AAC.1
MARAPGLIFLACVALAARASACVPDVAVDVGALDTCPAHAAGNGTCVPDYLFPNTYRVLVSGGNDKGGPTPVNQCHVNKGTHALMRAP